MVVATYHRPEMLERCLRAIGRQDEPPHEVIVVDNTAGDPEVERLAGELGARYLVEPRAGASRARNAGARVAAGDVVAFTDDDAVPEPDWLRRHAEALADTSLAATTGRIFPLPQGSPQGVAYAALAAEDVGPEPFRLDRTSEDWFERVHFGGVGLGPNMVFRRDLFARGWGLPEHLGPNGGIPGEEHYAFYTLVRAGHAVAYLPDARVGHEAPRSVEAVRARARRIVRGSAAYLVMLLVEERGYRRRTLAYALAAARGRRPAWRRGESTERIASRSQLAVAAVIAPFTYARARLRRAAGGA